MRMATAGGGFVFVMPNTETEVHQPQKATAATIFASLKPASEVVYEEVTIEVGDVETIFNIKRLGYAECARTDAKRYRKKPDGRPDFNAEYAATNGIGWQIHACVITDANEGKVNKETGAPLPPDWKPLFTVDQISGPNGIMATSDPKSKELIYRLLGEIWRVNPELSPSLQAQAAEALGS